MIAILPSGQIIHLAVFETPLQMATGLMGVPSMRRDVGALFCLPETRKQPFWMALCMISLDIVWLDEAGCVVEVVTAPPCRRGPCPRYGGNSPSRYVLELNAGCAAENGLVPGAQVGLRWQA